MSPEVRFVRMWCPTCCKHVEVHSALVKNAVVTCTSCKVQMSTELPEKLKEGKK